jgi:hypothetical protein
MDSKVASMDTDKMTTALHVGQDGPALVFRVWKRVLVVRGRQVYCAWGPNVNRFLAPCLLCSALL